MPTSTSSFLSTLPGRSPQEQSGWTRQPFKHGDQEHHSHLIFHYFFHYAIFFFLYAIIFRNAIILRWYDREPSSPSS